ncbi:iron complex transport system substrate-binding protein [Paenibacillus tianmuensis]|uniref:Iron complex transport system substrate-binding protein n=1 Tax=Paenibacillus tianmuensis TaxID=624147 RepID=A0A1G4RZK2_9BACL|nr:helix-turn-helix domain-containing protein [Paenibacillus tianmuensis]SCW62324.1 iron complex transport system substrate-binding protein [Paenibacillus tianmuensis]
MSRLSLPFRSLLFTLSNIMDIHCTDAGKPYRLHTETYVLIAGKQGFGSAVIDGRRHRVIKGSCFLLHPNTLLEASADNASGLCLYLLAFHAMPAEAGAERSESPGAAGLSFTPHGELNAKPFGRIAGMLDELYRHRSPQDELAQFKQHLRLQELLYELYRSNYSPSDKMQSREAVRRSIDGLHRLDAAAVNVEALARQANIGTRQYTHLFRQLTGLSPLDYMTELRLNEAKKKLLTSSESLQQIAQSAGFKDVYYFSRRFKQMVGQSPRQYVRHTRQSLRVVALYYANVLLAIGVKPIGANLTWWGGSVFLQEMEKDIVDIGCVPSLETVSQLEPDLILINDHNLADYASLSKIAPTVMLPYEGRRSIYEDTRLIGELINKPHAAGELQSRFERRAAAVREKLAGIVSGQATAAIVRFEREGRRFSVFGDNYGRGGWPIYRGLKLSIPDPVQREAIDSGLQIVQNLPLDKLPLYAGNADYLFVADEGEGIKYVENSPVWHSLPAVWQGQVHVLDKASFSYFDPISIEGQLELLAQLLLKRKPAS